VICKKYPVYLNRGCKADKEGQGISKQWMLKKEIGVWNKNGNRLYSWTNLKVKVE
jgi:hypothetical protein